MAEPQARWAIVSADHGREEAAERAFLCVGLRTYLPRRRKFLVGWREDENGIRQRCNRGGTVMRPLLPGFLFAELWSDQWLPSDTLDRWRHWRFNRERAFVEVADLDVLRAVEREGKFDDPRCRTTPELLKDIDVGSLVQLERAGIRLDAVIEDMSRPGKLLMQTMMFRREVRTTASAKELVADEVNE